MMIGNTTRDSSCAGFTILTLDFFATGLAGQEFMRAFFFVLSLGLKQMALYLQLAHIFLQNACMPVLRTLLESIFMFHIIVTQCLLPAIYSFGARYYSLLLPRCSFHRLFLCHNSSNILITSRVIRTSKTKL